MKFLNKNLCMGFIALTCGLTTMTAQVTIGSDASPNSGALLDVKTGNGTVNAKGGINFPRVNISNFSPATDEAFAASIGGTGSWNRQTHIGLAVYNTGAPVGLHVWNGTMWVRPVTQLPTVSSEINQLDLRSNATTTTGGTDGSGGVELPFGTAANPTVTIPENGAYAFNFRLYGPVGGLGSNTAARRTVYYLSIFRVRNGVETLADIAEINIFLNSTGSGGVTYSVALGGTFEAGDVVKFKFSHNSGYAFPWTLSSNPGQANRTSMIWWKL